MRLTTEECGPATLTTTGCVDRGAVRERDAGDPALPTPDGRDLRVEAEARAACLGGPLQVARGQLRIVDVAAGREQHRARDLAVAVAEGRVVRSPRRREALQVVEGQLPAQPRRHPSPRKVCPTRVSRAQTGRRCAFSAVLMTTEPHWLEACQLAIVGQLQMLGPMEPVVVALVGQRRPVQRRVVDPDHRRRAAGRAVARSRQRIEAERPPTAPGELQRHRGTDHAGTDDHRVVPLRHAPSCRRC